MSANHRAPSTTGQPEPAVPAANQLFHPLSRLVDLVLVNQHTRRIAARKALKTRIKQAFGRKRKHPEERLKTFDPTAVDPIHYKQMLGVVGRQLEVFLAAVLDGAVTQAEAKLAAGVGDPLFENDEAYLKQGTRLAGTGRGRQVLDAPDFEFLAETSAHTKPNFLTAALARGRDSCFEPLHKVHASHSINGNTSDGNTGGSIAEGNDLNIPNRSETFDWRGVPAPQAVVYPSQAAAASLPTHRDEWKWNSHNPLRDKVCAIQRLFPLEKRLSAKTLKKKEQERKRTAEKMKRARHERKLQAQRRALQEAAKQEAAKRALARH